MAMNCSPRPLAIPGLGGVTWIEASVAVVTVRAAFGEVTPPKLALTEVAPVVAAVARPLDPDALLMVATAIFEDAQVTDEVRFCAEPSV